jgi:transcriptional regulator with XRE-family HTH domain
MVLFRRLLGDVLRRHRVRQGRTLRDVAAAARISLGYLSEIERGRKEASSELLGSLCEALGISLADILSEVSHDIAVLERGALNPVGFLPAGSSPAAAATAVPGRAPVHASWVAGATPLAVPVEVPVAHLGLLGAGVRVVAA